GDLGLNGHSASFWKSYTSEDVGITGGWRMALKKCGECGGQVSSKAKACPQCGAPVKQDAPAGCGCLAILFLIVFTIAIANNDKKSSPSPSGGGTPAVTSTPPSP